MSANHLPGAATPAADRIDLPAFVTLVAALGCTWVLIRHFELESVAFVRLVAISIVGFAVHYFLPLRYRLQFFVLLSLATIVALLGALPAAWLIGTGVALIALCHAPVSFKWRIAILVAAGVLLAFARIQWVTGPWPAGLWPILGSMFMFRLAVYVYDVSASPKLAAPMPALAYFFLLPNVCFPLFPVVDYAEFRRTYYNTDRHLIYQIGVQWIFRGVLHLLLYRLVYQTLVTDPVSVVDVADLIQYLIWPFLLYLKVSGQFHVVVGLLHLFGFNLPETHRSYYLTSSFTDFWRRINIYWKDFMMKLVYYPAYFAMRKRGDRVAIIVATLLVFAVTWVLHAYQWFWIRGSLLLAWHDVLFWTILAICVLVNTLREVDKGRRRTLAARTPGWGETLKSAAATLAMFCTISVLWSLWSTESLAMWLSLWSAAVVWPSSWPGPAFAAILAVPGIVFLWAIAVSRGMTARPRRPVPVTALTVAAAASVLVLVGTSTVYKRLGKAGTVIAAMRFGGLNQGDAIALERGYYEDLTGVARFNAELWNLYANRPPDWNRNIIELGLARHTEGVLPWELLPSISRRYKGADFNTNSWGMHDKEYPQTAERGCYRIAVLGASHAMGSGVARDQTFEALTEARLNRPGSRCVEILNFAVYGYNPLVQVEVFEKRVLTFRPQAILYVGHPEDSLRVVRHLAETVQKSKPLVNDYLHAFVTRAGVVSTMNEREINARLAPLREPVLLALYSELVARARARAVCAGFVFLPMVAETGHAVDVGAEVNLASQAGFTMLDLTGVYGKGSESLWVADWDAHPNAQGHALVADRLVGLLEGSANQLLNCRPPATSTVAEG